MTTVLLFAFIISPLTISFAQSSAAKLASYNDLLHEVRSTFARGEERTADAVERERVQTYWEVGKLIDEHILLHKDRAEYGQQVITRLSRDVDISARELHFMVEFARAYPIVTHASQLTWSDYRDLLSVNDNAKRKKLTEEASKNNWTRETLRKEIKKIKLENPQVVSDLEEEPLIPIKGKLDTYRIVSTLPLPSVGEGRGEGDLLIDLGFSNYLELPKEYRKKFKEGDIVKAENLRYAKDASPADLFTYRAKVLDITDGDTLWLWIDLGFGVSTKQHVRLRGIDTPEIAFRDGQAAKEFVERELKNIPEIIITTSKSDKYDRYLADIYYIPARDIKISAGSTRATRHGYETKKGERYLNNRLLEEQLAQRV